ncbi:MAG: sigma-E processing peptidase SpoIIGA [Bacillota bacterium]
MELTIYYDLLFIINLVMNYLLLWTTAKLIKIDYQIWRLLVSALCGTIYTILILFPQFQFWNNILVYFLLSILMVSIAYLPLYWKRFLKAVGYFYLITFLTAGILMALYNLNFSYQLDKIREEFGLTLANSWLLVVTGIIVILVGKFSWRLFQRELEDTLVKLQIQIQEEQLTIQALVDTGNSLRDPLTDLPVIVVELDNLVKLFPEEIKEVFSEYDLKLEQDELITTLGETKWANRVRLIPFRAVGSDNQLLVGLKPDKVSLELTEGTVVTKQVILGIYEEEFDQTQDYSALLNPELF